MADVVDLRARNPDSPFIVGSTVSLTGGSTVMTVRKAGKQSVTVDWHDTNDALCSAEFPPAMLRHADPNEAPKENGA